MCSVNLGLAGVYKYKSSHKDHLNKSCCPGTGTCDFGYSQNTAESVSRGERGEGYVRELELSMTFSAPCKHKLQTCQQADIQPHALSRGPRGYVGGMRSKGLVFYGSCYLQLR